MSKNDEGKVLEKVLAVETKKLTKRGPYGYAIDLNKKALMEGWELECQTSGIFQRAKEYLSQNWVMTTKKIPGGFLVRILTEEEAEHGQTE